MSRTPEQFIKDNLKWFTLIFLCLFLLKSGQSCSRKMSLRRNINETDKVIDSLNNKIKSLDSTLTKRETELTIANMKVQLTEKRADDVIKTANNKSDVYVTNKIVNPTETQNK